MRRPIVCVLSEVPKLTEELKRRCAHNCDKIVSISPKDVQQEDRLLLKEADIIVSDPNFAHLWLNGLHNLKFVHGTWAGADRLMRLVQEQNVTPQFPYCRFAGRFGQAISEYVISYIVAQERNFRKVYEAEAECKWSQEIREHIVQKTRNLDKLSIGILGVGDIGKCVAKMCKTFGMTVWGMVTSLPEENACQYVDEYRTGSDIDSILSNCDYLCSILPSTPKTRGLFDGDRFKACSSKQPVFMNVGRGDICSEQSILNALQQGWIRAAILDVLPEEPLPSSSLLWKHPNVTITPHCSALSLPDEVASLISENIENYMLDRPLKYVIDWSKGY
ncbi:glyoxylate/hydroxypyruvate reductase A-like [Watersipora subatra]|uniref:glyoxylate/hydroxypyruvate reductase A-like n=1 Tax=Watersipora subatra TaxID=2589382 RepID=UPI00355BF43D